jgi:hypothetical protein
MEEIWKKVTQIHVVVLALKLQQDSDFDLAQTKTSL